MLTPEQQAIVAKAAKLSRENFAPRAARFDEESSFPFENYRDLHEAGLLGLNAPKEYGGGGADSLTYALSLKEIAKGDSATGLTFNMHSTDLSFIAALGTPAQKERYLGEVVKDGKLVASITSEPESSFRDRAVLQTVFTPVDGGYRVTGTKFFCSLGDAADYYFLTGVLEGDGPIRERLLSALVPRSNGGVEVVGRWNATGMRGTISHTIRYDTVIRYDEVLGGPGDLLTCDLSGFALGYAAVYLGIAEAAFDFMVEYAKTRPQRPSNRPLAESPMVQHTLGEVGTAIQAGRLMLMEAARAKAAGNAGETMLAVNQAKYYSAEVGVSTTEKAVRFCGGRGILKELPVERWHRDSLAGPVMPPSNDRCLETIGKVLCGLKAATLEFE